MPASTTSPAACRKQAWEVCVLQSRFNHRVLYDVLMCRRPDKILDLGQGAIVINLGAAAA